MSGVEQMIAHYFCAESILPAAVGTRGCLTCLAVALPWGINCQSCHSGHFVFNCHCVEAARQINNPFSVQFTCHIAESS